MSTNDQRVAELIDIFQELADTSGGMERTSIWPSLTVIDSSPANLGTDYIIIEDSEGFYIPALKVPGVTYSNGDLVNVLFIKGSEPIAFQQGPGSSSGGGGGGSGWPFASALTVSTTDADADYDTMAAAITAAASGDMIMLDSENFSISAMQQISASITIEGRGQGQTIITNSVSNAPAFDITADGITVIFRNLTIRHSGGGAAASCIFSDNAANIIIDNCTIEISSGAPTTAAPIKANNGTWYIRNGSYIYSGSGTNKYAIYNDASVGLLTIHIEASCSVWGLSNDIRATGNATIRSYGAIFLSNTIAISGSAAFAGWYTRGTSGISYFVHTSYSGTPIEVGINRIVIPAGASISAGIWLIDESAGYRTKYSTIDAALSAASTGDTIKLESKTYTITGSLLDINKSVTIEGDGPEATIITSSLSNSPTADVTANNVTLRNLTIRHTGTGTVAGPLSTDNANLILDNVILDKTSGASTTSYGLWLYGGSATFKNGTIIRCTAGTNKYGLYNSNAACTINTVGGQIGGDTYDIITSESGSVINVSNTVLTNATHSWAGVFRGIGLDAYYRPLRMHPVGIANVRLTLTSGTPVTTGDVTAATTIYATPYGKGSSIEVYNGYFWLESPFAELSLSLSGWTASRPSDIFMYDNAGTIALERTEWTNDTTRATALTYLNGSYVKSGATTRLYIGTIRTTTTTGQCEDSATKRYVWNYFNRIKRHFNRYVTGGASYTTASWRQWNADANAQIDFVIGVVEDSALSIIGGDIYGGAGYLSLGLNSTTGVSPSVRNYNASLMEAGQSRDWMPNAGKNTVYACQYGAAGTTYNAVSLTGHVLA